MADPTYTASGDIIALTGENISYTPGQTSTSLLPISSLITELFLVVIITAGILRLVFLLVEKTAEPDSEPKATAFKKAWLDISLVILGCAGLVLISLFFNPDLVKGDFGLSSSGTGQGTSAPLGGGGGGSSTGAHSQSADAVMRKRLGDAGIKVNVAYPKTMVDGMREETFQALVTLKNNCTQTYATCVVTVSGGTEPGHQTHGINELPVDLQIGNLATDPLYLYITKTGKALGGKVDKNKKVLCHNQYVLPSLPSRVFCDEPTAGGRGASGARHWHVS